MQFRSLLVCTLALVPASGAQLTQNVSCGFTPSTVVTSLPVSISDIFPPQLDCGSPPSFVAVATASEFHLSALTDQAAWPFPLSLSSRVEIEGRFLLSNVTPGTLAFWSACVTSTISGGGSGSVTGTYGPYGIGSPCDFAHSQPVLPNNEIDEFFTLYAQGVQHGVEFVSVNIGLNFFDAAGNPPSQWGFHYSVLPGDVPEPPSLILILLSGGMIVCRALHRWPLPCDHTSHLR